MLFASCSSTSTLSVSSKEDNTDPYVHFILGAMYDQARLPTSAYRSYLESVRNGGDDPYLWFKIGMLSLRLGDLERSAQALSKATRGDKPPVAWLRQASAVQRMAGHSADALHSDLRILELHPGDEIASLSAAKLLIGLGLTDSAVTILQEMEPRWPDQPTASKERAELLLAADRAELIQEWCANPQFPIHDIHACLLCAVSLEALGRFDEAESAYVALAARGECNDDLFVDCFQALYRMRRYQSAHTVTDMALACDPSDLDWMRQSAIILLSLGEVEEAREKLEVVLRVDQENIGVMDLLSTAYIQTGQMGRALSLISRAISLEDDPVLIQKKAAIIAAMGNEQASIRELLRCVEAHGDSACALSLSSAWLSVGFPERGLQAIPRGAGTSIEFMFQRASLWERLACVKKSRDLFENILADDPGNDTACNYLGYMLAERGIDLPYARKLIECAVEKEPDNPYYLDSLAWVYFMEGRYEEALPLILRAQELTPDEPEVLKHLGEILIRLGRLPEGLMYLQESLEVAPWDAALRLRINRLISP